MKKFSKLVITFATVLVFMTSVLVLGGAAMERGFNNLDEMKDLFQSKYFFDFNVDDLVVHSMSGGSLLLGTRTGRFGCSRPVLTEDDFDFFEIMYYFNSTFTEYCGTRSLIVMCYMGARKEDERFGIWVNHTLLEPIHTKAIDGIECNIFIHRGSLIVVFETDDAVYQIIVSMTTRTETVAQVQTRVEENQVQSFIEYVLSIVTPAIENRTRGVE